MTIRRENITHIEQPLSPEEVSHQAHLKSISDEIEDKQAITTTIRKLLQRNSSKGTAKLDQELIITKEEYWTYIQTADYVEPKAWDEHGGKLMVFGDEDFIMYLVHILWGYDTIKSIKYAPPHTEMGYKPWALMVYCLDSEQDIVWETLQKEGATKKLWKYDKQTIKDWEPDGRLYKRWQRDRGTC